MRDRCALRLRVTIPFLGAACFALAGTAHADEWRTSAAVYGHFAGLSGDIAIGQREAGIHSSFSELADHLDVGGMMALRNEREGSAIFADAVYSGLDADEIRSGARVDLEFTQEMIEVAWSWRLDARYELFAGVRYQSLSADVGLTAADGTRTAASETESWVDPILGARAAWSIGESWRVIGAFDVGGFGVGSDLTWSALAVVDWSVAPNVGVLLGYRAIDTDYEQGSGDGLFRFDMLVAGPLLGFRFDFGS